MFLLSAGPRLPVAQNNPHTTEAHLGVPHSEPLHRAEKFSMKKSPFLEIISKNYKFAKNANIVGSSELFSSLVNFTRN